MKYYNYYKNLFLAFCFFLVVISVITNIPYIVYFLFIVVPVSSLLVYLYFNYQEKKTEKKCIEEKSKLLEKKFLDEINEYLKKRKIDKIWSEFTTIEKEELLKEREYGIKLKIAIEEGRWKKRQESNKTTAERKKEAVLKIQRERRERQTSSQNILHSKSPNENKELKLNDSKITANEYYLFFDTETTGLPRNWQAPVSDLNNWPRLIQLAYLLYDKNMNKIAAGNFIVKPNGFNIPIDSSRIHGISNERAISEGVLLLTVLHDFSSVLEKATHIVAHNISFDEKIIGAEFLRNGMTNSITTKTRICTMEKSTNFCAIEGLYGHKWPKLSELHYKLFGEDFTESHNASVDVTVTAKCFWELRNRKII